MRWFMSYCYTAAPHHDRVVFACVTYTGDEHPVAKVKRWNQRSPEGDPARRHVLIHFCEFTVGEPVPEIDCSCGG